MEPAWALGVAMTMAVMNRLMDEIETILARREGR
jgi:hypothetical protein